MNQQLQNRTKTAVGLRALAESPAYQNRFKELMRDRAPQFVASLVQLVNGSRQLQECEPNSIIAAAITAAALDLPIDKNLGFAHIVPYGGQAQFQIGYKGFVQLALRTGQYRKMNAKAVNAEAFGGYDEVGDPVILWDRLDETKEEVGYVFAWQMTTGFTKCIYWPKEKVVAHAQRYSQAYKANKKDSPWFTNFRGMGLKTVVKDGLSHWGIMSVSMLEAIRSDQGVRPEMDAEISYPDNEGDAPELQPQKKISFVKTASPQSTPALVPESEPQPAQTPSAAAQEPAAAQPREAAAENPELVALTALLTKEGITPEQMIAFGVHKKFTVAETLEASDKRTLRNLTNLLGSKAGTLLKELKAFVEGVTP